LYRAEDISFSNEKETMQATYSTVFVITLNILEAASESDLGSGRMSPSRKAGK